MTEKNLTSLLAETQEWGALEWWRLELRSFADEPRAQYTLVVLAPREAVRAEYRRVSPGSCLQSLAYMFLLVAPLIGAVAMFRWVIGGSAFDFPLAIAGTLTLISLPITGWSELQGRRFPRAVSRSSQRTNTLLHVVPGTVTAIIALTAGRELLDGGAWAWLAVIGLDVMIYVATYLRGNTPRNGPQNPHDNVDQAVREIPADRLTAIVSERDAAIDRLVRDRRISAASGAQAQATPPGHLALTLAPEVGSAFYRPDQD